VIFDFSDLARNPPDGVSVGLIDDNLFKWELMIIGKPTLPIDISNPIPNVPGSSVLTSSVVLLSLFGRPGPSDTLYEGGFFSATLEFPSDFPNMPPVMTFKSEMWHPNGKLC
jgi:ubiquitin-conjugating enzyme E2 G1